MECDSAWQILVKSSAVNRAVPWPCLVGCFRISSSELCPVLLPIPISPGLQSCAPRCAWSCSSHFRTTAFGGLSTFGGICLRSEQTLFLLISRQVRPLERSSDIRESAAKSCYTAAENCDPFLPCKSNKFPKNLFLINLMWRDTTSLPRPSL